MAISEETKSLKVPGEKEYGYSQAIKVGDTISLWAVSHDDEGDIVGRGHMEMQMRQAYANVQKVLAEYGTTMANIVDEVFFVEIWKWPTPKEHRARFRWPNERIPREHFRVGPCGRRHGTLVGYRFARGAGFVLGFAINHGSICTVIATTELVSEKRPARFIALVECAVWAALVYAILETSPTMQQGWSPLGYLVPAAMLFGIGIYVNGACVFGSVGHFGNGDIDFGFAFLGIFAVFYIESLFGLFPDQPPISASLPLGPVLLAIALLAILALRLGVSLRSESNFRRLTLSMGAIGITFTILAVFAPGFSITASVGSIVSIPVAGAVIAVCMFGGSLVSARFRKRRFMLKWPTIKTIVRRTLGGILMGLGALLIPGGNDTLLMVGFPMGAWQAALAYVLFVATLAVLIAKFGSMARAWS